MVSKDVSTYSIAYTAHAETFLLAYISKRDWNKKKYPSATTTAEGYFSALGATPHGGTRFASMA